MLFLSAAAIGILVGVCNYLFAFGMGLLLVSTATLILETQLAFVALYAFLLLRQKFTAYSVNTVILLIAGACYEKYVLGIVMLLAMAALSGLIFPLIELTYVKTKQAIAYSLVMDVHMVICFVATVLCTIGMIVIPREAREFQLGETKYYMVLVWSGIISQFYVLGASGIIFCASSFFSGLMDTVQLPIAQGLAVIFYHDKFQAEKGVSLALSLGRFVSYFDGEFKQSNNNPIQESDMSPTTPMLPHA